MNYQSQGVPGPVQHAWEQLQYHLLGDKGLIAQIERNEPVEPTSLRQVEDACTILQHDWAERTHVSKHQVLCLWKILSRCEYLLGSQEPPGQEQSALLHMIGQWIEEIVTLSSPPIDEQQSLDILYQEFSAFPSFGAELNEGTFRGEFFRKLIADIETLADLWRGRQKIPREAGSSMIASRSLSWSSTRFSDAGQQLEKMEKVLYEKIESLLS